MAVKRIRRPLTDEQRARQREYCAQYDIRNREKRREYGRNRRPPESRARKRIARRRRDLSLYGLTPEQFDQMLAAQCGKCAVCSEDLRPGKGTQVDHCHSTGAVRGLLCARCNPMLGLAKDDGSILNRAAEYLAAHRRQG